MSSSIDKSLLNLTGIFFAFRGMFLVRQPESQPVEISFIIAAKLYCGALGFLQFKEFELYWGAVFFLRSVHTFS